MKDHGYFAVGTDKDGNVLTSKKIPSDPGAIIDVLSEVLELIEMLRADVIQMLEDNDI